MHFINKIRWRVEKYILDPIINFYLNKRIYEKTDNKNLAYVTEPRLKLVHARKIFQGMISGSDMGALFQKDFDEAYTRGIANDPVNLYQKELLRYRVYINTAIASLAVQGGGDFCCVGVSWGIVPRTIYQYLDKQNFWKNGPTYFLVDKFEQVLFAGDSNKKIQTDYCGDIEFIKNEFKEENFQIIQKYAPEALHDITTKVSYLHLNTGDKVSELKTVKFLYDKLTNPGFIVIDNYHYSDDERSIDGYLKKKNNFVLQLGNSQGIVVKL